MYSTSPNASVLGVQSNRSFAVQEIGPQNFSFIFVFLRVWGFGGNKYLLGKLLKLNLTEPNLP